MDLIIRNSSGKNVSSFYYGNLFSPLGKPCELSLKPKEKYNHPVSLFATVNIEDKQLDQYIIQAVFRYEDIDYKSNTVNLHLK